MANHDPMQFYLVLGALDLGRGTQLVGKVDINPRREIRSSNSICYLSCHPIMKNMGEKLLTRLNQYIVDYE